MPVSTRSKRSSSQPKNTDSSQEEHGSRPLPILNLNKCRRQEDIMRTAPCSPQDALKHKMKALTLLYEQHKRALQVKHDDNESDAQPSRIPTHPNVDLINSHAKTKLPTPFNNHVGPADFKENQFEGFHESKVARKLSLGPPCKKEENAAVEETESSGAAARIHVFVRLRPMMKKEQEAGSKCCVRIVNKREVYLAEFSNENDYLRMKRLRGRHFTFDASFPDSASQQQVYSTTTAQVVEAVLKGRNGSVFCYGATGAGKTYTMLGTVENPGVMVLAIKDLFDKIRQRSSGHHVVHLSYLEVYNETVRDLLSPGRSLVLREDKQGIVAAGLTQYKACSTDEVMALLQQGNLNRTTEPTRANQTSSRSHAILQVLVEYKVKDSSNNDAKRVGKLSLVDLAGSERALATDQRTLRSLEGANINKSLLALSSCINALAEGKKHIPYRNSKLTQLLKDSLGGTCITVMIANISPSSLSFGETQNTLHWADRAKEIRIKAGDIHEERQQPDSETTYQARLLLELQKENRELRMELARQQQKLMTIQAQTMAAAAAAASPTPSKTAAFLSPTPSSHYQPNGNRKPKSSFLGGSCFSPKSKGRVENERLGELSKTVKALEAEIERINRDYMQQMKQKDDYICELSRKVSELGGGEGGAGKRSHMMQQKKETTTVGSELMKIPINKGPVSTPITTTVARKRSFWDITTANSPSVATVTGRKTRSHTAAAAAAPSLLPQQPGFGRQRTQGSSRHHEMR